LVASAGSPIGSCDAPEITSFIIDLISSRLELISHKHSVHSIVIQEIRDQYQHNEEDWYTLVLHNIMNFHAEWNNGHTFEIGPGEVCDTGIELLP
jgi:hypothetical protein